MPKTLHVPDESRFITALALAVEPADTMSLLMEIGALKDKDLAVVRRVREALAPAYELASERQDWELANATGILANALAEPDYAAFLAQRMACPQLTGQGNRSGVAEALAIIGCGYEYRRRPWAVAQEPDGFSLGTWKAYIWRLLHALPGRTLPMPSQPAAGDRPPACVPGEVISARLLQGG